MKLDSIKPYDCSNKVNFDGKRLFKNTVSQLSKNNHYSLTEVNQRNIKEAIEELGKIKGSKNIKFLINTAEKLKYSTNIILQDMPKTDWRALLIGAATASAAISSNGSYYLNKIEELRKKQDLTKDDKDILDLREKLLSAVDLKQIQEENLSSEKNFKRNLDYFIVSSETTTKDKKYVLDRLNYFMSDNYKINSQLKDKKSVIVAEMINDMAIHTPGSKFPNIKVVNQKQHGMCAAISIVRKKLVYEDKPKYVDSILSELDNTDYIKVYDRSKLGTGKKIQVQKVPVDFETAIKEGYRIIDASTMHWMQIAQMAGSANLAYNEYTSFDKENFGVKRDSFFNVKFQNEKLSKLQDYYQALLKAKSVIQDYKAGRIKLSETREESYLNAEKNTEIAADVINELRGIFSKGSENITSKEINKLISEILGLKKKYSNDIGGNRFAYIHNEEDIMKKNKIKDYILANSDIKDIDIDKVYDLVEYYQSLNVRPQKIKKYSIPNVRKLYEIGAAFRHQIISGLDVDTVLKNSMVSENLGNKENIILNTLDEIIYRLETNSPYSDLIFNQLSSLNDNENTKEGMLTSLRQLRESTDYYLTDGLDNVYKSLLLGSRHQHFAAFLNDLLNQVDSGDRHTIKNLSEVYNVNPKNLANAIEKDIASLQRGDEDVYNKIFDRFEISSQIAYLKNLYAGVVEQMANGVSEEYVKAFMEVNGITSDNIQEGISEAMENIKLNIDIIEAGLNVCSKGLDVVDKNGSIIISANPKNILIKLYENKNKIPKKSSLLKLQEHLEKISKDKSSDEFNSRQGKLKDKSLYLFSNEEKELLSELEDNINTMSSYVQKELNDAEKHIKPQLEELKRIIGVNNGHYWVSHEGSSGLSDEQQVRILEYMTGKPHYISSDKKEAIKRLKHSPKSGITSSSVYHNAHGWHAQYIADIKPVEIKTTQTDGTVKTEKKDILLHDNTWGVSENENIWVDSNGLTRTDYSDNRGGSLGYITNDKLQNGNFVERIINSMLVSPDLDTTKSKQYKKIKNIKGIVIPESMQQYGTIILEGRAPKLKTVADRIHDAMFVNNTRFLPQLQEMLKIMTQEELESKLNDLEGAGKNWKEVYNRIKMRIFPIANNTKISEFEYNRLADDDYLKVLMEKIALKQGYQIAGLEPDLARVRKVSELRKFKAAQKTRALNTFKYSFAKDSSLIKYISNKYNEQEDAKLESILKKYGINLTEEEFLLIGDEFGFQAEDANGSLKTFIDLIINDLSINIDKLITNPDANKEIKDFYRNFLETNLYFNKKDINNPKIQNVIEFIDREFDPADDAELVKIYRKIQDMTLEEFKKEILPKVKPEDLGIKKISGYEVLKQIQNYDEAMNNNLVNTIYYDSLVPELNSEEYSAKYTLEKLSRTAKYNTKYNFTTIYRDIQNDLESLTMSKLFNKYKDRNIRKYNAYPAYPKPDYMPEKVARTSFDFVINEMKQIVDFVKNSKGLLRCYEIKDELLKFKRILTKNEVLTPEQESFIKSLMEEFCLINNDDSSIQTSLDAANSVLELPEGSKWKDYLPYVMVIVSQISEFEKTSPSSSVNRIMENNLLQLDAMIENNVKSFVRERYQNRLMQAFDEYKHILIKQGPSVAEQYEEELFYMFSNSHLLNNPTEILDLYLKSLTSDSSLKAYHNQYKILLERCLTYSKLGEIEEILMDAAGDGIEMNTKSLFSKYIIELEDEELSMNSGKMISYMIHQLMVDGLHDTALRFIDKLGLGEDYVEYMSGAFDFKTMKESVEEAKQLMDDFNQFQTQISKELKEDLKIIDNPNSKAIRVVNKFKRKAMALSKQYNMHRPIIKPLLDNIKILQTEFAKTEANKTLLFSQLINSGMSQVTENINEMLSEVNSSINGSAGILNVINSIMLKENCKAVKQREDMNEKFAEIFEMFNNLQES